MAVKAALSEESETVQMFLRIAACGLTVGLLIVLPALKILGIL